MAKIHTNIEQVKQAINALQNRATNLAPIFQEIANELERRTQDSFEKQASAYDGKPWQALKPSTLDKKAGRGRILHDHGDLEQSISSEATSTYASIGTNVVTVEGYPYPAVHQFGSADGQITARAFLPFQDNDIPDDLKEIIIEIVNNHFEAI